MNICKIEGCTGAVHGNGYCHKHNNRFQRHGDPLFTKYGRDMEKHNGSTKPEYSVWRGMKKRCYYEKSISYPRYGGRGITVCDRWLNSFANFYADMGDRPTPKHRIDRIDNDGNYEPDNCRWVLIKDNNRNKSTTKLNMNDAINIRRLFKKGLSLKELSEKYNICKPHIFGIVNNDYWEEGKECRS